MVCLWILSKLSIEIRAVAVLCIVGRENRIEYYTYTFTRIFFFCFSWLCRIQYVWSHESRWESVKILYDETIEFGASNYIHLLIITHDPSPVYCRNQAIRAPYPIRGTTIPCAEQRVDRGLCRPACGILYHSRAQEYKNTLTSKQSRETFFSKHHTGKNDNNARISNSFCLHLLHVIPSSAARHGDVDEAATRVRCDFRVMPVVHRSRASAPVPGVPIVYHVLLRLRVLLRVVRVGSEPHRSSHVDQSRRQLVVEMRLRVESGESAVTPHKVNREHKTLIDLS